MSRSIHSSNYISSKLCHLLALIPGIMLGGGLNENSSAGCEACTPPAAWRYQWGDGGKYQHFTFSQNGFTKLDRIRTGIIDSAWSLNPIVAGTVKEFSGSVYSLWYHSVTGVPGYWYERAYREMVTSVETTQTTYGTTLYRATRTKLEYIPQVPPNRKYRGCERITYPATRQNSQSAGDASFSAPSLTNEQSASYAAGLQSGCSACSNEGAGEAGAFDVKIHLGDSGFGPVELIYSGDLGSNLLLKRSNLKLSELLGTPGVTIVNGSGVDTLTLTHAITNQPISTVVVSYSLTPGSSDLLTSLTIVLTPSEPTNDPTTHLFVPSTSGAYSGITYTKTKADTIASAGFLSLDPAAPVNNLGLYGAYRIIYPDGRMRELVAAPPVTSGSNLTFTWVPNVSHPNGGSYEGLLHEEVTETSGLSGARPVKIHRYYRQIGDAPSPPPAPPPKIAKVLVLEESVPLGGTEAETRSVIFGYDDRLSVTGKYGLKVGSSRVLMGAEGGVRR